MKKNIKKYLWDNNPALVQLLGLCPLLGVSNSFVNSFGLSTATILILTISNLTISLSKKFIENSIRLPIFILIIATTTTIVEILMKAYLFEIYSILGLFIPLITTNCIVLGRAEAFAFKNNIKESALDGFLTALGFSIILILIGTIRELLGTGSLFNNTNLILNFKLDIQLTEIGFLFFSLPPGAFLILAFLIALKNYITNKK